MAFVLPALLTPIAGAGAGTNAPALPSKPLAEWSLEELQNVEVRTGTLGGSDRRTVPATVTTITADDIKESGARNLNELLEMYVPNLLYLRHNWEASHIGIRGVVGDIDNKYLFLVNGKVMNNLVHAGAISERDLALLGDIREVQVIRGPGSAVYGAGALIGVVDIQTFDGASFTGTEVTARAGAIEEFYSAEWKSGIKLGDNAHLFLYGGISRLVGADPDAAPLVLSLSGLAYDGTPITAGEAFPVELAKDRRAFRGLPPLKFHAQLTAGDFSLWARFARGGEVQDFDQLWLIQEPYGFAYDSPKNFQPQEIGYQQLSVGADYRRELSDHWDVALRLGYSTDDFVRREFDGLLDANREDLYTARALATWQSSQSHSFTFGVEYTHAEFGLPTLGYPAGPAVSAAWVTNWDEQITAVMPRWSTDTYSFLAEDHWDMTPRWSLFSDLRADKNSYTDFMLSPRVALVHTPTSKDTVKLIVSQAVKANVAEELRWQHEDSGAEGDTERLRAVELAYNRLIGEHVSLGGSAFFNDFKIIGWDGRTRPVGEADIAGFELEAAYHSAKVRLGLSHSFSQLVDFRHGSENQFITAEPHGFGHDLNHWSTHITKLHFAYRPIEKLQLSGALRVFWGWPGWEDFSNYENSAGPDEFGDPRTFIRNPNYNPYDKIQARLNLGASYAVNPQLTIGAHGYNLLGLLDEHLNDRFIMFSSSARRDAAAAAVTVSYKF